MPLIYLAKFREKFESIFSIIRMEAYKENIIFNLKENQFLGKIIG